MILTGHSYVPSRPRGESGLRAGHVGELGLVAHAALRAGGRGRIVAVFERCFYATLDGHSICVGSRALGSGPLHVLCEDWPPRRLAPGNDVAVVGTEIHVEGAPLARFGAAPVWAPDRAPDWTRDSLCAGLRAVDELWSTPSTDEGLVAMGQAQPAPEPSRLVAAARPGVAALNRIIDEGLRGGSPTAADHAALAGLIGLGPGLTPSGDDLLLGALVALASLGCCDARDALWEACRGQLDRTNEISRAHLEAAALGCGAAALHGAVHATMSGSLDLVQPSLLAVAAIGHTSGRDGFAGALIALRVVARQPALRRTQVRVSDCA